METAQNMLFSCSIVPQLAEKPKGRGLCLQAVTGTPIMCILSQVKLVKGNGSVLGILNLSLNSAGMKGVPNARGIVMSGNYCGRAEATAGSSASLPGPMDVHSRGHWCFQHLSWLEDS